MADSLGPDDVIVRDPSVTPYGPFVPEKPPPKLDPDDPVDPSRIPVPDVHLADLEAAGRALKRVGGRFAKTSGDLDSAWRGLSAFYRAPEASDLIAATRDVPVTGEQFGHEAKAVGEALLAFVDEVRPIVTKLHGLRAEATDFRAKVDGNWDGDFGNWQKNGVWVKENNRLNDAARTALVQYQEAERACANKITALFGGTHFAPDTALKRRGDYIYGLAEAPKGVLTPWGAPQTRDKPWYQQLGDLGHDFAYGLVSYAGAAVGANVYGEEDSWGPAGTPGQWLGRLKDNWSGMLDDFGTLINRMDGRIDENGVYHGDLTFGQWWHNMKYQWPKLGSAIIHRDDWHDRPVYAVGGAVLNIGMLILGGGKGLTKLDAGLRDLGSLLPKKAEPGLVPPPPGPVPPPRFGFTEIDVPEIVKPRSLNPVEGRVFDSATNVPGESLGAGELMPDKGMKFNRPPVMNDPARLNNAAGAADRFARVNVRDLADSLKATPAAVSASAAAAAPAAAGGPLGAAGPLQPTAPGPSVDIPPAAGDIPRTFIHQPPVRYDAQPVTLGHAGPPKAVDAHLPPESAPPPISAPSDAPRAASGRPMESGPGTSQPPARMTAGPRETPGPGPSTHNPSANGPSQAAHERGAPPAPESAANVSGRDPGVPHAMERPPRTTASRPAGENPKPGHPGSEQPTKASEATTPATGRTPEQLAQYPHTSADAQAPHTDSATAGTGDVRGVGGAREDGALPSPHELSSRGREIFGPLGADAPVVDFATEPIHPRAQHDINERILKPLVTEYPGVAKRLEFIGTREFPPGDERLAAAFPGERGRIYFNPNVLKAPIAEQSFKNFHVLPTVDVVGIGTHELGHIIFGLAREQPQIVAELESAIGEALGSQTSFQLLEWSSGPLQNYRSLVATRLFHPLAKGSFGPLKSMMIKRSLSEIGASNAHELIAEAFCEYRLAESPRPLALAVGQVIDRHFNVDTRFPGSSPSVSNGEPRPSASGAAARDIAPVVPSATEPVPPTSAAEASVEPAAPAPNPVPLDGPLGRSAGAEPGQPPGMHETGNPSSAMSSQDAPAVHSPPDIVGGPGAAERPVAATAPALASSPSHAVASVPHGGEPPRSGTAKPPEAERPASDPSPETRMREQHGESLNETISDAVRPERVDARLRYAWYEDDRPAAGTRDGTSSGASGSMPNHPALFEPRPGSAEGPATVTPPVSGYERSHAVAGGPHRGEAPRAPGPARPPERLSSTDDPGRAVSQPEAPATGTDTEGPPRPDPHEHDGLPHGHDNQPDEPTDPAPDPEGTSDHRAVDVDRDIDNNDSEPVTELPPPKTGGPRYPTIPLVARWIGEDIPGNKIFPGKAVEYLNAVQRERYRIWVDDQGLIRDINRHLLDTTKTPLGAAISVMDEFGNMYASNFYESGRFQHSSFLAGQPVAAAVEIRVIKGRLEVITDGSGHYKPPFECLQQYMNVLQEEGVYVDDVFIQSFKKPRG
ncbi:hypothetical protein [Actinomadura montaniterrae]|uniref:Tox-PL domain-containing protein n=1 Tax=Actinomadura montaniterrae TaxID=1803903 RepID=A0A6L3W9X7_9ACTN|nr:hypothetical protein [Actinomadura montaniterrae]KAB2388799.1 hypothetical protein F9B16_02435 [Actinomadura montaniterrae]